jgi:hypothetical protein
LSGSPALAGRNGGENVGWADTLGIHATTVSDPQPQPRIGVKVLKTPTSAHVPLPAVMPEVPSQVQLVVGPLRKPHKGLSHRTGQGRMLFLTNNQPTALRGAFRVRLDNVKGGMFLRAVTGLAPGQVQQVSGNEILISFGPDGLPPGGSVALQLDFRSSSGKTVMVATPHLFPAG